MSVSQHLAIAYAFEVFVYVSVGIALLAKVVRNRFHHKPFRPFIASIAFVLLAQALSVGWRLWLRIRFEATGEVAVAAPAWAVFSIVSAVAVIVFYFAFTYTEDKLREC